MVLDENLNPLHELTEDGKKAYQKMIDDVLSYKKAHPFLYQLKRLLVKFW